MLDVVPAPHQRHKRLSGVMMRQHFVKTLAVAALVAAAGVSAHAQGMGPIKFGVSGGASVPVSDLGNATNTGFTLTANLGVKPIGTPFTMQLEGGWNQWGIKNASGNLRALTLTGNLLYDLISTPGPKPYVIGTAGLYHLTNSNPVGSGTFTESSDKYGLGIGGGVRIPLTGFDTYIEARYQHALDSSVSFVPITFGVRF